MRKLSVQENIALGFTYLTQYRAIRNFLYQSPEQIRAYQFKKIQQLITLAFNETEFYREKYTKAGVFPQDIKTWEDFEKIPTTTKSELIEAGEKCIVRSRISDKSLMLSKSSGSSGKIIHVKEDGEFWIRGSLISLRMFQQAFNYSPTDKQALIYTSEYPYDSILGFYKGYYINTLTPISEIISTLVKLNPEFIVTYPSIIVELIQSADTDTIKKIRPKAISTNSEYLSQAQRDYISDVFNCNVFDEYSSEELSYIAYQCRKKTYHIQEDSSYIEILDTYTDKSTINNSRGEIVGTCLLNNVMPFIRYRQGDLGELSDSTCSCGSHARVLNNIAGRKNSYFTLRDGTQISSGRLLDWTYELILKEHIPILQYELVQLSYDEINLNVIPKKNEKIQRYSDLISKSFKRHFNIDSKVTVNSVQVLEKTSAGKHLPIKSLIKLK